MNKNFKNISTKPHYESGTWGSHKSIFAYFIYKLIFLLRYLSPLQWIKEKFRKHKKKDNTTSANRLDPKARLDFHAQYTELYLMAILILSILSYYFQSNLMSLEPIKWLILFLSCLLLVESIVWVSYYMVFRVLMERKLIVYDEAEYLVGFPVALITQIYLISIIVDALTPSTTLALLFRIGSKVPSGLPQYVELLLGIIGLFYLALVIASLIKIVPAIPVWRRPNVTVIGSGDVVSQRILPTLLKIYSPNQIAVVSDFIKDDLRSYLTSNKIEHKSVLKNEERESIYTHEQRDRIKNEIVKYVIARSTYAIIATPSDEHFPYILALANEGIKFAVEKPVCVALPQLHALKSDARALMDGGFLLSYYWLEKGLPLNYFLTLNPTYRDLLLVETSNDTLDTPSSFSYVKKALGKEELIVIEFLEGDESEDRFWTEIPETGGMIAETLIHPFTMVKNVIGIEKEIKFHNQSWIKIQERQDLVSKKYNRSIGPTYVDLVGQVALEEGKKGVQDSHKAVCKIRIRAGKYANRKKRIMHIIYENGKIIADFDEQKCSVYINEYERITIKLKHDGKYETQQLLFHEFMQKGWKGLRYDDFPSQVDVLISGLNISPDESKIKIMKYDQFNYWLDNNLLFDGGCMQIGKTNYEDRFGPIL